MTEAEWLTATDPHSMIAYLKRKATSRKLRLFACACCRRAWDLYSDERNKLAIIYSERYCDGEVNQEDLLSAATAAAKTVHIEKRYYETATATCFELEVKKLGLRRAVESAIDSVAYGISATDRKSANGWYLHNPEVEDAERPVQAEILRDIIGNPFRRVSIDLIWLTSTVVQLGEGIYQERTFLGLPILADALQEAGCNNDDILNHLRNGGSHVRGCWALDLILGKK